MERMSPVGSIMWGLGQDATLRMVVGNVMILDRAPARDVLAERLAAAAVAAPRLRQRPDAVPGTRTRPNWVDELSTDTNDHIRTMAVPSPGDLRTVLDLVTLLETSPFDSNLSPWDVTIIEGLEGGKAGLFLRAHHALTDGLHGVSIVRLFLDESEHLRRTLTTAADTRRRLEPEPERCDRRRCSDGCRRARRHRHPPQAGNRQRHHRPRRRRAAHRHRRCGRGAPDCQRCCRRAAHRSARRGAARRATWSRCGQLGVAAGRRHRRPVVAAVAITVDGQSLRGVLRTSMHETRHSRSAAAATTCSSPAPRSDSGSTTSVSVSRAPNFVSRLRRDGAKASTAAARSCPTRVEIPAANGHPGRCSVSLPNGWRRARREPVLHMTDVLASAVSHLPTRMLMPAVRSQANSVDFVATSLPGIRGVRHICGAVIEQSFPFGPRLGSLMNITGFGVDDRLDIGVGLDPTAIAEPDVLVECMLEAFQSFAGSHGS